MEEKKKKVPKWLAAIGALTASVTLLTVSGLNREGIDKKHYPSRAPDGYCTILVYMDGSDLESDCGAATADLAEMEDAMQQAGIPPDTLRVVVEAGGAARWEYKAMQGKEYGRFCLTGEGVTDEENMEKRNMGRADTLADFINYGTESYPAEHYGLVLWNHGAGPIAGFGSDSNFESSSMSLAAIQSAFEQSDKKEPFEFVSLDACLMGNLELVSVLQNKTEYLIASEELEPQNGYDYAWMKVIAEEKKKNSDTIGRAVGEEMLATYEASYVEKEYQLTLSLIDVEAYEEFHEAFHETARHVLANADEAFYRELGEKRNQCQGFGDRQNGTCAEIVDVGDFLKTATELTGNLAALELLDSQLQHLVLSKVTKGYPREPSGLSIYLPSGANEWLPDDMSVYETVPFCKCYEELLQSYQEYLSKENHWEWRTPTRKEEEIRLDMDSAVMEEITAAYLTVFVRGTEHAPAYLLSTDSDVTFDRGGFIHAVPEETYWGLKGEALCLIEILNTGDCTEYLAPVLYNGELCQLYLGFDEENPDGVIRQLAPAGVEKKQYQLEEGDTIVPLYPLAEENEESEFIYDNCYDKSYYMGQTIVMESLAEGDAIPEKISVKKENCSFGFLLQDTRQKLFYTDSTK